MPRLVWGLIYDQGFRTPPSPWPNILGAWVTCPFLTARGLSHPYYSSHQHSIKVTAGGPGDVRIGWRELFWYVCSIQFFFIQEQSIFQRLPTWLPFHLISYMSVTCSSLVTRKTRKLSDIFWDGSPRRAILEEWGRSWLLGSYPGDSVMPLTQVHSFEKLWFHSFYLG